MSQSSEQPYLYPICSSSISKSSKSYKTLGVRKSCAVVDTDITQTSAIHQMPRYMHQWRRKQTPDVRIGTRDEQLIGSEGGLFTKDHTVHLYVPIPICTPYMCPPSIHQMVHMGLFRGKRLQSCLRKCN